MENVSSSKSPIPKRSATFLSPRAAEKRPVPLDTRLTVGTASPTHSVASLRSRAESETDYEESIAAPRPRSINAPSWLKDYENEQPVRVSSPLNPKVVRGHTRKTSLPMGPQRADSWLPVGPSGSSLTDSKMESPMRRWVRWMVKMQMRDYILPLGLAATVWVKWAVGLGEYSGYAKPPMYGDYEAQRHWMELTVHLPTREWYTYDLQYWGLDYPPLTAYVSYVCGIVAHAIDPSWVALDVSRGVESMASKLFMRTTVLSLDLFLYTPAVIWFAQTWFRGRSRRSQYIAILTILLQPSLIIIDNGHFQYNSVMLGFTLLSLNLLNSGRDVLGAIAFVLSLCFKQMSLYYSPVIFAYLLGRCIILPRSKGLIHLGWIGLATTLSFFIMFSPFIVQSFPSLLVQSLVRIFPFSRGLFEDKVANFWCATNVVIKWRSWLSGSGLPKLATLVTLLAILPPMLHLLAISYSLHEEEEPSTPAQTPTALVPPEAEPEIPSSAGTLSATSTKPPYLWPATRSRTLSTASSQAQPTITASPPPENHPAPTINLMLWALFNSSMAFFLFSFQVHEKSVLLPLLPLTLILSGRSEADVDSGTWEWGVLINNVALFSLWPLLKKDGLGLQYASLAVLWNYIIGYNPLSGPKSWFKYLSLATYGGIGLIHTAEALVSPPPRYPDMFPVLNVLLSFGVFGLGWLWGLKKQMEAGWAVSGMQMTRDSSARRPGTQPTRPNVPSLRSGSSGAPASRRFTVDPRMIQQLSEGATRPSDGDAATSSGLRSRKRQTSLFVNGNLTPQ